MDSGRWCEKCQGYGSHHTENHDEFGEELSAAMMANPDYKKQVEQFKDIINKKPCGLCGDKGHSAVEGHKQI